MNSPQLGVPRETLLPLLESFRRTKHDVNNALAVLMALAEMAERNPANYQRLAKAVLERCPKLVDDLQDFQEALSTALE
ncbi:MAG: hypothetical protein RLZZ244_2745 [Verrucomicrobiota bacterium]